MRDIGRPVPGASPPSGGGSLPVTCRGGSCSWPGSVGWCWPEEQSCSSPRACRRATPIYVRSIRGPSRCRRPPILREWSPCGPQSNGLAVQAGLLSGDTLVAVNDVPVPPALTSTAADHAIPPGIAGSAVTLDVRTGDAPLRRYRLVRSGPLLFGRGLAPELVAGCSVAFDAGTLLLVTAISLLIFLRCSREWPALLASAMIVALYAIFAYPTDISYAVHPAWRLAFEVWSVVSQLAICLFFYLFPNGQWLPRWSRIPVVALAAVSLVVGLAPGGPAWAHWAVILCWLSGGVIAQVIRFGRYASMEERRQIVWVASGATAAFLGAVILTWVETGTGQPATFIAGQPPGVAMPFDLLSPNGHLLIPSNAAALPYDLLVYPLGRLLILLLPLPSRLPSCGIIYGIAMYDQSRDRVRDPDRRRRQPLCPWRDVHGCRVSDREQCADLRGNHLRDRPALSAVARATATRRGPADVRGAGQSARTAGASRPAADAGIARGVCPADHRRDAGHRAQAAVCRDYPRARGSHDLPVRPRRSRSTRRQARAGGTSAWPRPLATARA